MKATYQQRLPWILTNPETGGIPFGKFQLQNALWRNDELTMLPETNSEFTPYKYK